MGECQRKSGACLRCESVEHRVRNCPRRSDQVLVTAQTPALGLDQPPRVVQQPPKGRRMGRGGNGSNRGQKAAGRGVGQIEARQPTLVYATRRCEDNDDGDVIVGTFFIQFVSYFALIDIR